MRLFFCLIFISSLSFADTKLLLIGGGKRPVEAMKEFTRLAGGNQARILVIPWASESTAAAEAIKAELACHSIGEIEIIPHSLNTNDVKNLIKKLENSSGIFFTGGDQNKLMSIMKSYQLRNQFRSKFFEGVIFGGTSAGTAIMSNPMLTGSADLTVLDGTQVELAEGLGLLPPSIIVDQHFIMRSRFNRLAGLILKNKAQLGIGVDENTSLLIRDREAQVIGPSQVLFFKRLKSNELNIRVLGPQDRLTF
jgi:cyanophycinase